MSFFFFLRSERDPFAEPLFRLDAVATEEGTTSAQLTKVPVENRSVISDYRYVDPDVYKVEGRISPIMPIGSPRGESGVSDLIERARRTILDGDVVTCVFGFETRDLLLKKITRSLNHSDGYGLRVVLEAQEVQQITTEQIQIHPSRFRRRVRRRAVSKQTLNQSLREQVGIPNLRTRGAISERVGGDTEDASGVGPTGLPAPSFNTFAKPLAP